MIQCSICQMVNDDQSRFCAECGARLGPAAVTPQAQQQGQQPPQAASAQSAAGQQPPLPHPGNRLHSPLLGSEPQPATDLDRLRKMQGKQGGAPEGSQPPAPPEGAPRKLRSPLLAGEEFDDPEDYPPQAPPGGGGRRLHSPLLGEGGGGGGPAPDQTGGRKLHSPLLGDQGGGGYEDYPDNPPQQGGRMHSPLLGGGGQAPGGKFRSPLLSGAAQGQGGATFDEYYDDQDAIDEEDPNILRSPLLSARTRRPAGPAPGQPGQPGTQAPGPQYPPQPGPEPGAPGYYQQPGPNQGYQPGVPPAAPPVYPPAGQGSPQQPAPQAYPQQPGHPQQPGGYPQQQGGQPGVPVPGQATGYPSAQPPQMPPQPVQPPAPPSQPAGFGQPVVQLGFGQPTVPPAPATAGGFGSGYAAAGQEAPIPGLSEADNVFAPSDQDATSDVLPGFPGGGSSSSIDEAFPDMTQFRRANEPEPVSAAPSAPMPPALQPAAPPPEAAAEPAKAETAKPPRRPSKLLGADEPQDAYDDQPFVPPRQGGSYGAAPQQAANPLPKILGGLAIVMALAKLPAVILWVPFYMSPGQNPVLGLDYIVTTVALIACGIGLISTRN